MQSEPIAALFTTMITEAELFYGAAVLPDGRRRRSLESVLIELLDARFADRVLPFDSAAAREFPDVAAARSGKPIRALPPLPDPAAPVSQPVTSATSKDAVSP
jgi:predicted nucleic acid-binding protein